jgi:tetratricopeptide (TPR) repeat protein
VLRLELGSGTATVTLADGTKEYPVYSTPADIVVPGGVWRISLTRPQYKGREITISVAPHSIREVKESLEADSTSTTQGASVPVASEANDFDANQHVQHGCDLKFARLEDAAEWEIDRAREVRPEWPTPLFLSAEWSAERGDTAAAKVSFEKAVSRRRSEPIESAVPPSSRNAANLRELAAKAATLERAAAIKSDDYDLWSYAGNAWLQANDRARAARNYKRSLREYAGNGDALAGPGEIALAKGDLSEAERYCKRASDSQSETWSRAWNCLGRVFEGQKAWANAQTAYENAIWSDPENSEHHCALADVLAFERSEGVAALQRWMADELLASAK